MLPVPVADSISDPRSLFGLSPSSEALKGYLEQLTTLTTSKHVPTPEIKSYPDALYMNYYPLGLSLLFVARDGSKSITRDDALGEKLVLDSIDIYNVEPVQPNAETPRSPAESSSVSAANAYSSHPVASLTLCLLPSKEEGKSRSTEVHISPSTTGKEIVGVLEEPDRKGGGAGPASGSIGIWCEWSRDGIMVEFGGIDARGPQAWERGKDAKWRVLTLFRPNSKDQL
ncbi:hypothetical protein M0805_003373 [Coniferiporia weirii]|nr:hypothetical protein M0805_003373 [Coniferiporia weirii]